MAAPSQLPDDIWFTIIKKLKVAADRIRFRSACKSWRSLLPFPQPPWLMLAEDDKKPSTRGFFGMGDEQLYEFEVPELYQKRIVGSQGNWLICVDFKGMIQLFNPFSRLHINLPPQSTFEYYFHTLRDAEDLDITPELVRDTMLRKVVLSPSSSSSLGVAMAIFYHSKKLAIARPGDTRWTTVKTPWDYFFDIIFFNNQFYAIDKCARVVKCDVDSNPPSATIVAPVESKIYMTKPKLVFYLVQWKARLLFVIKRMCDDADLIYKVETFYLFVLNFTPSGTGKWQKVENLEEYSLFLGFSTSIAVSATEYPSLRRNCIYFTDDYVLGHKFNNIAGGHSMGIFNLEDKSILPLPFRGTSTSRVTPPVWIVPQTHS